MLTKEITKGMEVRLTNGFRAEVMDNQKNGTTRLLKVFGSEFGFFDEMGSEYVTKFKQVKVDGKWVDVTLTEKQKTVAAQREMFGF